MKNESQSQSMLARLLSKENISVQHGNYSTAFFDVKERILGLPIWKDKGKDVYDLLVGHEVGHALYTPSNGLDGKLPCAKSYLNIVEDVRIERMIQSTYPGLVGSFRRGYGVLNAEDFFGTKGKDTSKLGIGDRVNLHAKLGRLANIQFAPEEQEILSQVMSVVTWEDTVAAAVALEKFAKAQAEKQEDEQVQIPEESQEGEGENSVMDPTGDTEVTNEPTNQKSEAKSSKKSEEESSEQTDLKSDKKSDANKENSEDGESRKENEAKMDSKESDLTTSAKSTDKPTSTAPEIQTERNFEQNAKSLLDTSVGVKRTCYMMEPSKDQYAKMRIGYKEIFKSRDASIAYRTIKINYPSLDQDFTEFMGSTKKFVSVLQKEFDMRKAAYQYSRSTVSDTGILNVNKLHNYRYSDDIFLSVSQLANAKNHGMMMFVDYSSSMNSVLPYVLKHIINLSLFCKSSGIPFEVYGFTANTAARPDVTTPYGERCYGRDNELITDEVVILQLVSSTMSKPDFNRALKDLFIQSNVYTKAGCHGAKGRVEELGSTPLNETLIAAHHLVKSFKDQHKVQKMTTIVLTDGEGQNVACRTNKERHLADTAAGKYASYKDVIKLNLNGRTINSNMNSHEFTAELVKNLKITTQSNVIGFFIPSSKSSAGRHAVTAMTSTSKKVAYNVAYETWRKNSSSIYSKEKSICISGAWNYDEYFIVASGSDLDTDEDELVIDSAMTRSKMARAFSQFSKSKQVNRVFVSKFAKSIA
jgi:hypothetical protein